MIQRNDGGSGWTISTKRKLWPQYTRTYEDAICRTSTAWAAWYIIPANRKWFRKLAVASILVETLQGLKIAYPEPPDDLMGFL